MVNMEKKISRMKKREENRKERLEKHPTRTRISIVESAVFIITVILIYFFVYGYIANVYEKYPGDHLLFIYKAFFSNYTLVKYENIWDRELSYVSYYSVFIFLAIMLLQGYKENFLVYALKNAIWVVPVMMILSWVWYAINYQMNLFIVIGMYFSDIDGYINIVILLALSMGASLLGAYLKTLHYKKLKKMEQEFKQAQQREKQGGN